PEDQPEALAKDWVDVGFGLAGSGGRAINVEKLLTKKLVAVIPEGHRLADRSEITLQDLAGERLVSIAQRAASGFVHRQNDLFLREGLTPTVVQEAPDPQVQLALVAAGVGPGLHLASIRKAVRHRGVVFIPLAPDPPSVTLTLLWRRDDDRELLRLFLETAREVARSASWPGR
ncbi:MAG: LysR family substrate-binding domain-containing protein, partial [Actinomycetota bacterium]|nr:LysR family substrate-binding domain-containing protein [Actinomycetota bacterium]